MRFVVLAIVLMFPLLDLVVTARFARWTGVPMWMWLARSARSRKRAAGWRGPSSPSDRVCLLSSRRAAK